MALSPTVLPSAREQRAILGVTVPSTDQRGFPLDTPVPDIGAFQTSSVSLVVVATGDDNGQGAPPGETDLRGAVNVANIRAVASTITFDPNGFRHQSDDHVDSGRARAEQHRRPVTIIGPVAGVTISGDGASRVFQVDSGSCRVLRLDYHPGERRQRRWAVQPGNHTTDDCTISGNSATRKRRRAVQ